MRSNMDSIPDILLLVSDVEMIGIPTIFVWTFDLMICLHRTLKVETQNKMSDYSC